MVEEDKKKVVPVWIPITGGIIAALLVITLLAVLCSKYKFCIITI